MDALAPATSAADLKTQAQQAYAPLSNILYNASSEVHPRIDPIDAQNALRDWSGYKWGDASKTSKEVQTLLDKPQLSANDIQQSQSYLKGIARNPNSDPNDALYASHYVGKLQDVLENGTPQTGVPAGAGPGYAAQVKAEGDVLHGRANDVDRLNDWIDKSQVAGGPDVGSQAGSYLRTQQGQRFAPPGSPGYDALNTLAGTAQGPLGNGQGLSLWDLKHHLLWPGVGLGVSTAAGSLASAEDQRHSPWLVPLEAIAGLGAGLAFKQGLGRYGALAQQRTIDAARTALSTGQQQSPVLPTTPLRDAIRQAIYSGRGRNRRRLLAQQKRKRIADAECEQEGGAGEPKSGLRLMFQFLTHTSASAIPGISTQKPMALTASRIEARAFLGHALQCFPIRSSRVERRPRRSMSNTRVQPISILLPRLDPS